jgi:hypothetical protein
MAQDIRTFTISVPKGGTANAPQKFELAMPPRIVKNVELFFPAGNGGQLWIALGMAGTRIIPSNSGQYITAENDTLKWPLDNYPNSGAWQLFAYNTGNYPHMIQIRFLLNVPGVPEVVPQGLTETLSIVSDGGGFGSGSGSGSGGGGQPSFSVPPSILGVTLKQGGTATTGIGITELFDTENSYTVTVVGLPSGLTPTVTPTNNRLIFTIGVAASNAASVGTVNATVQVSSGGITQTSNLQITVQQSGGSGGGDGLTAVPTAPAASGFNIAHLPVGAKFYVEVIGIPHRNYHFYDNSGTWQGDITTDASGKYRYPISSWLLAYSGMEAVFEFCLTTPADKSGCQIATVVCP